MGNMDNKQTKLAGSEKLSSSWALPEKGCEWVSSVFSDGHIRLLFVQVVGAIVDMFIVFCCSAMVLFVLSSQFLVSVSAV